MSDRETLFEELLGAWKTCRDLTVAELGNIPADRLDHRPAPESRSVGELIVHIVDAGLAFAGESARTDGDLTRKPPDQLYAEYASGGKPTDGHAALMKLLQSSGAEIEKTLRSVGPGAMLDAMPGIFGQPVTRFAVLHFAVEHESYHRGQIAVYARTMGLIPALTQMLQGTSG
ncbi:MAG: DinB family protein [Gemmatimonadetes bacterium]|nr:DinB family protein [Gemmatimonadota bacterium]